MLCSEVLCRFIDVVGCYVTFNVSLINQLFIGDWLHTSCMKVMKVMKIIRGSIYENHNLGYVWMYCLSSHGKVAYAMYLVFACCFFEHYLIKCREVLCIFVHVVEFCLVKYMYWSFVYFSMYFVFIQLYCTFSEVFCSLVNMVKYCVVL